MTVFCDPVELQPLKMDKIKSKDVADFSSLIFSPFDVGIQKKFFRYKAWSDHHAKFL